jgi:ribonucleoside-triphosphate reductase (thioredoxin)
MQIGINKAARTTCIKPSGTTSLVLGSSSGIHAWHSEYFLRTIRFNKNEDIALYMMVNHPELVEEDQLRSDVICVRVPMKAPDNAILRSETAIDLLERVKKFSIEWIKSGHKDGANTHNVSATISIDNRSYLNGKPTSKTGSFLVGEYDQLKSEWQEVGDWMWNNKDYYNGLSVLPFDNGTYTQAPFESTTKKDYESRLKSLTNVDLTKVVEIDDNTAFTQDTACAGGGSCEINV